MQILLAGDLHLKGSYTDKPAIKPNFYLIENIVPSFNLKQPIFLTLKACHSY